MKYKVHPVAAMFPMMEKGSRPYNDLQEHVRLFGQLEPIVVDGDVLLDGRNRLAICEECGITPKVIQWESLGVKNPQHEWIFGKNAARRNLTEEQRGAVYVEYDAWTLIEAAKEKKEATMFKEGKSGNPSGKAKEQVNPKSGSPEKRDATAMHSRSTAGRVAEATGLSRYKAEQIVALGRRADAGDPEAIEDMNCIKAGIKTISEIQKKLKPKKPAEEITLQEKFNKWWPKCLSKFAVSDHRQIKIWIKDQL